MSSNDHTWRDEYTTSTPHPTKYDCKDLGEKVVQLQREVRWLLRALAVLTFYVAIMGAMLLYMAVTR